MQRIVVVRAANGELMAISDCPTPIEIITLDPSEMAEPHVILGESEFMAQRATSVYDPEAVHIITKQIPSHG